jgi:hypothetical protein
MLNDSPALTVTVAGDTYMRGLSARLMGRAVEVASGEAGDEMAVAGVTIAFGVATGDSPASIASAAGPAALCTGVGVGVATLGSRRLQPTSAPISKQAIPSAARALAFGAAPRTRLISISLIM